MCNIFANIKIDNCLTIGFATKIYDFFIDENNSIFLNYKDYQFSRKRLCKILSFSKIFLKSAEIEKKHKIKS